MIRFHSKRALLWPFNFTGKSKTYLGLQFKCQIQIKFGVSREFFFEEPPPPISNFTEMRLVGTVLLHADRRTDAQRRTETTKLIGAFCDNVNAPKQWTCLRSYLMITTCLDSIGLNPVSVTMCIVFVYVRERERERERLRGRD
jgi:hypothetical protein